jgi:hypothetical protein
MGSATSYRADMHPVSSINQDAMMRRKKQAPAVRGRVSDPHCPNALLVEVNFRLLLTCSSRFADVIGPYQLS